MPPGGENADERKSRIVDCVRTLCCCDADEAAVLESAPEVDAFLNDGSCRLLQVFRRKGDALVASNELRSVSRDEHSGEVTFMKSSLDDITSDNFSQTVIVNSTLQSPLNSLYHAVHSVYAPVLLRDPRWSARMSGAVQDLLTQLDTGLGGLVREGESGADSDSFAGIVTTMDEFLYWEEAASRRGRGRTRAEKFNACFDRLKGAYETLKRAKLVELVEMIDETESVLDEVWKQPDLYDKEMYSQERMENLFSVIGGDIVRRVQEVVRGVDLWTGPFSEMRTALQEGVRVCERWATCTAELTGTYWATYPEHKWRGNPHSDNAVRALSIRLEDLLRIRTTHEELLRLLSPDEQVQLRVAESFEPFSNAQPLHCNAYTQPIWEAAMVAYERRLAPVEQHVSGKLRKLLLADSSNPQAMLKGFQRFQNVLGRAEIARLLVNERETLLSQLSAYIEQLDSEFEAKSVAVGGAGAEGKATDGGGPVTGRNLSPTISALVWAKQLGSRVSSTSGTASALLGDLPAFHRFDDNARELEHKVEAWESDTFRGWVEDVENQLMDGELSLQLTGQLMEIDIDGLLQVNFSERLVTLLREVRVLGELGFAVPRKVRKAAEEAERYYRFGVMLKKTANFYNTMESQIIETQKAMLYEPLVEFEREVTNPRLAKGSSRDGKTVTWADPSECQEYVQRLRGAATKLSTENRRLRKTHERLGSEVVALMNIDLLRSKDKWKAQWKKLLAMMTQLEGRYESKRTVKWKLHWDHQLYKALEASYKMGLESLNENLSEIKAELVFTNKRLQFRPPLEELRASYYREMKKFVSMPNAFSGFGNRKLFAKMADINGTSLVQVYTKAEALFARLSSMKERLRPFVLLGRVSDLDTYVEEKVTEIPQYESNLKCLKSKRREVEKMPDFFKIDCFTISVTALKSAIEDQHQRFGDALVLSLRKSVLADLRTTEAFLDESMEKLSKRPDSIEAISEAKGEWIKMKEADGEWRARSQASEEKKKLLLQIVGAHIDVSEVMDAIGRMPSKWDNFTFALEGFNDMIEDQRDHLRSRVSDDVAKTQSDLSHFRERWRTLKPAEVTSWHKNDVQAIFDALTGWRENMDELLEATQRLTSNCEHFGMPPPTFEGLEEVEEDVKMTETEWKQYEQFHDELEALREKDWITFRANIFEAEDLARKWLDDMKGKARGMVLDRIASVCDKLRKAVPALKFMRGEPFKEEHWTLLVKKLGMPRGTELQNLKFGHFVDVLDAVIKNANFARDMTARAQGEVTIREAIMELKAWSETASVEMMEHEELGRMTPLVKNFKDLFLELGDNQSLLGSLKESQYFKPFEKQASVYEANMNSLDSYLMIMNQVQRKWLYLEPIFKRGALPSEQSRFKRVDDEWVEIMNNLNAEPLLFNLCDESLFPRMQDNLNMMEDQLERCQKALAEFLEEKRSMMPRFYFIGDDDLLEILGQAKNPRVIQSHLKKLFQAIHSVRFSEDESEIVAMCSVHREEVKLEQPVKVTDNVEVWLKDLSNEMKRTLKTLVVKCVHTKESDLSAFPSQVLCLAETVKFTSRCEHAIKQGKLPKLKKLLNKTLTEYINAEGLDKLSSLKVKSLVMDLVHFIDVVDQLIEADTKSVDDWQWDKQLRYYIDSSNGCVVRMCDAEMEYTYEYWGNASKLVHTPLTDKCYLTLTQGMHMGFGGAPSGPAGTGKTESVKALGFALGRQVLVFNCDEGIDFQSMGRIFTGLVKCGAWGCFDEFNRLKEDQLSAVSQQIQVIQAAIKEKEPVLKLLDSNIDVDFNAGIFVTMNPAGKGYGGRSKLPDNLKQLFRPVAMSRPDNNLIAEVILYSEGFRDSKDLGKKMVSLYALSRELLSAQQHYDWGLRAMKAVLNTGGKLIVAAKSSNGGVDLRPEVEREILIKAVRVNTLPKLTFRDSQTFLGLIGDVFPNVKSDDVDYPDLQGAIKEVLSQKPFNLEFNESQVRKMLQLKESLDQRMGCVIVGPSGCGKSTVWGVLKAALAKLGTTVKTYVMNPKSMPRERLLGYMDNDTREWTDGVLTYAARQVVKEPLETRSWIICDGDVDPEWIESLNSVLDDNKLLTMPNGERISFGSNVNFIFETHDLRYASPATISRMGMIFLSDEDVDVQRLIQCWLCEQPEEQREDLGLWLQDYFYRALDWVLKQKAFIVDTTMVGTVKNGLSHIQGSGSKAAFVCGMIRGLGGNLDIETRSAFAKECFVWANERPPSLSTPLDCYAVKGAFSQYSPRNDLEGDFAALAHSGAIIQTTSVQRNVDLVKGWVERMEPFILVGPEGAGKSMLLNYCFNNAGKSTAVTTLHCNAQTTALHVIQKIEYSCALQSGATGRVYKPRASERLVLYLKDINLPKPDMYDTCMLIAFLQQLITFKGFYNDNLEFLGIEGVHIVASMNPSTTVGRHLLSTRFTAIVRIAYIDYPDAKELATVYSSILEAALDDERPGSTRLEVSDPKWRNSANLHSLAQTMISIYEEVKSKFSVDDFRHYQFTPRDLTAWILGLLRYDTSNEELLEVLAYESQRLFRDRLVDQESQSKFDSIVTKCLSKDWHFKMNSLGDVVYTSFAGAGSGASGEGKDADDDPAPDDTEMNEGATNLDTGSELARLKMDDLKQLVQHGMMLYEREEKELHIKLFPEVLENIVRIDRVLSKPGGALLLVGRSGVGRRTATSLVAHMHRMQFFSPTVKTVGEAESMKAFNSELKQVMQVAGVEGRGAVLYVEDHQVTNDRVLETLNSLLSSGEVPGLFKHEELVPLLEPLKEVMNELGSGNFRNPYEFFLHRVQNNLHVAVAMDDQNPNFQRRCESNPALFTKCTILWMGEWRDSSMHVLPGLLLPDYFGKQAEDEQVAEELKDNAIAIHASAKDRGACPLDFVNFLQCYRELYDQHYEKIGKQVSNLQGGLSKLQEASKTVNELEENAVTQRAELQEKQTEADESMDGITSALKQAEQTRQETEKLSSDLKVAEGELQERKGAIDEELAEIRPVLESAKEAVSGIKSDNLNEIRSFKMPPEAIHDVMSAVLMLLGINDTSWLSMKRFLANRGVKEEILNFDAHSITPDIRKRVAKVLKAKSSSFEHNTIYRISVAAAPLAAWVKANVRYSLVLEKIQPLEAEREEAEAQLESSAKRLKECESELQEIDDRVKSLQDNFKNLTREAEVLNIRLQDTETTLQKAQNLLGQLGGEQERWGDQAEELEGVQASLPSHILAAAAFTTYLGKAPEDVREKSLKGWIKLLGLDDFDYKKMLSSESQMLVWKSQGLPADSLSMENGVAILNSGRRTPFIIDPATTATEWLKKFLATDDGSPLEVVPQQDPRFVNQVELAVRFGKTLVIVEVDRVEPILFPLVRRDLRHQGPRWVVEIGDKLIDYNEKFRLFLVTRNPEPDLPPDARALISEVNFTVTRSGLEGQLLGVTVQNEQPELEQKKSAMLKQEEDFKVQLADLEKELLDTLASSEGNLLENQALLDTLTKTKTTSAEVQASLQESAQASEELDRQRYQYRPFSEFGSDLYFTMNSLSNRNHMYQFSLQSFITLFRASLSAPMEHSSVGERIEKLQVSLKHSVLYFVGRALFKADRLMFAMHLTHNMNKNSFQPDEWEFFVGEMVPDISAGRPRDFPSWAATDRAGMFSLLNDQFKRVVQQCQFGSGDWERWGRHAECEKRFPSSVKISPFQKVMVVQTLRPDRLQSALALFCCDVLGVESISPPPSTVAKLCESGEVVASTPVLMIATPGADPTKELAEYASKTVGREHYVEIAMGGGQTDGALTSLRNAARVGDWLCLKNLHLVTGWIPRLEKEFNSLELHDDFRLWLTTEESTKFPPILLQQSLKITFESPPGIKKNLQRTYENWSEEMIAKGGEARAQLLFALAWLHALVQERRTYIPQGWTKFYEFSLGDLRSGTGVVDLAAKLSNGGGNMDWDYIRGLMINSVYGGRVDNPFDLRVLEAYLKKFFCDNVVGGDRSTELARGIPTPTPSTNKDDYVEWIERLEDADSPSCFMLPANIERSVQRANSENTITGLKRLARLSSASAKFDRDVWKNALQPLLDLWRKLTDAPDALSPPNVGRSGRHGGESKDGGGDAGGGGVGLNPVDAFIEMEEQRAYDMATKVDSAITALGKVLYGTGLLTPEIQTNGAALMAGTVPSAWENMWEGPESPQAWLRGLVARKIALKTWAQRSARGGLLDEPLSLGELFNPGTFLNALRQQTARAARCSMDNLKLASCWDSSMLRDAVLPVTLTGMYLQGATLGKNGQLDEPAADAIELIEVPDATIAYIRSSENKPYADDRIVSAPVYYDATRERVLMELDLCSDGDNLSWICGGVALVLGT